MNDDFLRDRLRSALDEHTPDRTVMLNRIAANRAGATRPRGRIVRLAGSALAVVTVLGLGGVAKWAMAGQSPDTPAAPPPIPVTASPAPSASLGEVATATASPSHAATSRAHSPSPTGQPMPKSSPAASATRFGSLGFPVAK